MLSKLDSVAQLDERQFALSVRRLADSLSYGSDNSPFLGAGIEYVQSRLYQLGDPIKSIDWRVTARTGKPHVKQYEAPKRMPVYLLVDTSASMCVSSRPMSKYAWAVQLAGGLALAAIGRLSPVGLVACGDEAYQLRPSLSRLQIMQWLHRLRRHRLDERTSLSAGLRLTETMAVNRSLIIVLSDLHEPGAVATIKPLAGKHDVIVLHLIDPAERGRLGAGFLRAREAETGAAFTTTGRARWTDDAAPAHELKGGQVDHVRLQTDQPFLPHLRAFLRKRDSRARAAR
ncbi:MAG TPA: DUF58 domain-containing protein [Tepidisphaeraceae bacterium]|nr:DUF58 domain-containing protein [Tepidisphaeraceae bacterium]